MFTWEGGTDITALSGEKWKMTTRLKFSKRRSNSRWKKKNPRPKRKRVSELCFWVVCIIHFDGWILVPIPGSFVCADYKRPVSSAVQATKKRLSKGRNWLSSQDPSIVLQIDSRWGSFRKFSRRKIAPPCGACKRQGGFTVGMVLRNSSTTHVWWDFWGMRAGPQKSCCGWLQLHLKLSRDKRRYTECLAVWKSDWIAPQSAHNNCQYYV